MGPFWRGCARPDDVDELGKRIRRRYRLLHFRLLTRDAPDSQHDAQLGVNLSNPHFHCGIERRHFSLDRCRQLFRRNDRFAYIKADGAFLAFPVAFERPVQIASADFRRSGADAIEFLNATQQPILNKPEGYLMRSIEKKTAIITGASRGIGAAVAEHLAKHEFSVVINYSNDPAPAEKLAHDINAIGGHALPVQADVSDPAAVRRMFSVTEEAFGGVDVLINNAGVMHLANLADADDHVFDQHIAVNLKGTFNCLREAAKHLRDGGRIINFSSSVVGLFQPSYSIYAATKAGVEAMTHVLSKELRGRNITVNAVAPGPTGTDLFLEGKSKDLIDHYAKLSPLERLGLPQDIANIVAFLAGPDAGWINGQVVHANGGIL